MAPRTDFVELGSTGLNRQSGLIAEEFLPQLQGPRAIKVFKEMSSNDPVVGAVLFAIDMLVRQVSWTMQPGSESDAGDQEAAEFVHSCMDDMSVSWGDAVSEILSKLVFGWSYHETVYKLRQGDQRDPSKRSRYTDGRIGWRKLPIRAQETLRRWEFDDEGGLQAMVQTAPPDYRERVIPIEKALLFRTRSHKGNPEGVSILRTAYRPWLFKKRIEEIEGIGIERDLAGLPVAWVPAAYFASDATDDQKRSLEMFKKLARDVKRDDQEGLVLPLEYHPDTNNKVFDFTLLSTGGRRQFDTGAIIARYDTRIAMSCLADVILIGHDKVGSFALSADKSRLFATALDTFTGAIADVFNRHAIPRLLALNGMRPTMLPKLVPGGVEPVNLQELGEFISKLSGAGIDLTDPETETHLRNVAGLPAAQQEL